MPALAFSIIFKGFTQVLHYNADITVANVPKADSTAFSPSALIKPDAKDTLNVNWIKSGNHKKYGLENTDFENRKSGLHNS